MHPLAEQIEAALRPHADPEIAKGQSAYMKNHFPFLGIKTPELRSLTKPFLKLAVGQDKIVPQVLVRDLFSLPEREYQRVALDLLARYAKYQPSTYAPFYEELITTKSWWDSVDQLATQIVGPLFLQHKELPRVWADRWADSDNIWLNRTALLYQLKYRAATDWERLQRYIRKYEGSQEFFINKAIGWALREYAKTDPQAVINFATNFDLHPLSRREGLRRLIAAGEYSGHS